MEDKIFYIELLLNTKNIYFLDKPLYHYYQNINSCTKSKANYIKNIENVVLVNEKIINLLKKYNIDNEENITNLKKIHCVIIINFLASLFQYDSNNNKEKELINIFEKKEFFNLFKEVKFDGIKTHIKIPILLMKKRKYKLLFMFLKFRAKMANLKKYKT